jgi:hypothetical protein
VRAPAHASATVVMMMAMVAMAAVPTGIAVVRTVARQQRLIG